MSKFQIGIILGAIVLLSVAVLIITGILPGLRGDENAGGNIVMWGFEDENVFNNPFHEFGQSRPNVIIRYQKKNRVDFEGEFLNAIARGESPDIVVFPSNLLAKHKDKLSFAPSSQVTERDITRQFVESANSFLGPQNEILGIPLYGDSLILYFNKDIFTKNLVTLPPKTWDEFLNLAQKMTSKDSSGNILLSGAALGRASNINNATGILTALFLQAGEKIVNEKGATVLGDLPQDSNAQVRPAEEALRFFADFANPTKAAQSWSAALPESRDAFTGGKLAMYLGFVGEYDLIKSKNPHLNFDVSALPQLSKEARPITSGRLFALSVPKASINQNLAWSMAQFLTASKISALFASSKNDVSPRRDVLPSYAGNSIKSVFAESILTLKLWNDPDPVRSEGILRTMIEDLALGKSTMRDAIDKAKAKFNQK